MSTVRKGRLDNDEGKKWMHLHEQLRRWPTFGLFNIFMCHPADTLKNSVLKMLPLVLLVAQCTIPLALFLSQYDSYHGGYCPNIGTLTEKILMFAIAIMYTARSTLIFISKYERWNSLQFLRSRDCMPIQAKQILHDWESRLPLSILNRWGQVDDFMSVQYEGSLYLLNLWLVFISHSSMDMVLNSLAMEMVMKLDDEFKDYYFKANGQATMYVYENELNTKMYDPDGEIRERCYNKYFFNCIGTIIMTIGTRVTFVAVPLIAAATAVYSPFCK